MKHPLHRRCRTFGFIFAAFVLHALLGCSAPRPQMTVPPEPNPDIVFPSIVETATKASSIPYKHTFTFEGAKYEISIKIDGAALQGARNTDKTISMIDGASLAQPEQNAGLYFALLSDKAQDAFFADIIEELRQIKKQKRLDTDRYAELISVFVQSIDYCNVGDTPPKFPIETAADKCGDCDDKSLLAAGLLFRENYDVAFFIFREEKHTAVGIRSTDEGYLNSGYAYIETTTPSYIGFPTREYTKVKITSTPDIIVLGSNKPNLWTKSDEVTFLYNTMQEERAKTESISKDLETLKKENAALKEEYTRLLSDLKQSKGRVAVAAYNKKVDETNRMGEKLNRSVDKYNALAEAHNKSAEIAEYIFTHPDDRYGVTQWVKAR